MKDMEMGSGIAGHERSTASIANGIWACAFVPFPFVRLAALQIIPGNILLWDIERCLSLFGKFE